MRKLLFFNILVIFFNSCQTKETPQSKSTEKAFFDLKRFFTSEIKRLNDEGMTIQKTVTVNGKSEAQKIEKANFEDEFKMFVASDINRPAWTDKYSVETSPSSDAKVAKTIYKAKDVNLKTRFIEIDSSLENHSINMTISNFDNSVMTEASTNLFYDKNKGYTITTYQKLVGSVDSIKIDVAFLKK